MVSIFPPGFLNWLERNAPHTCRRFISLFQLESVACERIISRNYDSDVAREEVFEVILNAQRKQVAIFRPFSPAYLFDLLVMRGISPVSIWRVNGHH